MQLPPSAVICGQGEVHHTSYFVREGTLALCSIGEDGAESTLSLRGPRSLLCLEALKGQASPFEVRTLSSVRLCSMPSEQFLRWAAPEGTSARAVLSLVLGEADERYRDMSWRRGEGDTRVARFILAWNSQAAPGRTPRKQLIARLLGMRPESFSRCLRRLVDGGLVHRGSGMGIRDHRALVAVAQQGDS